MFDKQNAYFASKKVAVGNQHVSMCFFLRLTVSVLLRSKWSFDSQCIFAIKMLRLHNQNVYFKIKKRCNC